MSKSPYIKEIKDINVADRTQQKQRKFYKIIDTRSKSVSVLHDCY